MADHKGQEKINNDTLVTEQTETDSKVDGTSNDAVTTPTTPQNTQSETTDVTDESKDSKTTLPSRNTETESAECQGDDNKTAHQFMKPQKEIKTPMDLPKWEKSQAYRDYMGFVMSLNESVKGKKLTDDCEVSEACQKIIDLLAVLDRWIDEIPPIDQPQRFGNKAFRDWFRRLQENAESLIQTSLPTKYQSAVIELETYLLDSFGNSTRIDYGTGHEMNFAAFLCCLYKLRVLTENDNVAVVHKVFTRYLVVTRKLQTVYRMEPAGSQGVWGLDDFQFLPFLWGSSQLLEQNRILPKSLPNEEYVEGFAHQYMIFACIKFILSMKTGSFAEHSNTLWNISGVPRWAKVNSGLIKMYKAECLMKFPVVQHFQFGTIMSIQLAT
ncbi:serine/threonine-protein phosphatase 2A activator-like [Ptychodera flava]|uniref:serine/threonine-protein phosphatase 2A activator-like n=1 Tax=Ptychodera flava TaxID=63121 RepID=UPI00396A10CD